MEQVYVCEQVEPGGIGGKTALGPKRREFIAEALEFRLELRLIFSRNAHREGFADGGNRGRCGSEPFRRGKVGCKGMDATQPHRNATDKTDGPRPLNTSVHD